MIGLDASFSFTVFGVGVVGVGGGLLLTAVGQVDQDRDDGFIVSL